MANDPRAYALEIRQLRDQPTPRGNTRPHQDPTASAYLHRMDLGREPRILYGRIVDCLAYAQLYKVQPERGSAPLLCTSTGHTGFQLVGAKAVATYQPGSGVLILVHPQLPMGFILCAVPDFMFDATSALSDVIVQGSNVGVRSDGVHQFPYSLAGGGGLQDRSGGRPLDSLPVGEWGAITETGLAFFLDPFLAFMRVDEATGLFLFYHDQLTRLAGYNLQQWSAGRHREELDDQNEFTGVDGWTHQLFEARGTFGPNAGSTTYRTFQASDAQQNQPWYSAYEPAADDQIPFHRRRVYRGYLGQGGAEILAIPPVGYNNTNLHTLSDQTVIPGVFEQGVAQDGTLGIRSAKGIFLVKSAPPAMPIPKQLKTPQDPTGDSPAIYKHAGLYGTGPTHHVGDFQPGVSNDAQVRAASAMDLYEYLFNWKSWRHAFHYHALDWYIPQESAMPNHANMASGVPGYAALASRQWLPTPTGISFKVDERYGNVIYFPNQSMLALLEDGGIALIDGWGSEIRMSGGSIMEACAGDIWKLPGKNHNVWAGNDAIMRANGTAEVTANLGNVRIKAHESVLALAGGGGCGGFLFESRAIQAGYQYDAHNPAVSGFVVRCKTSPIALMGQDMWLTTGYLPSETGHHLVIDAGTSKLMLGGNFIEARALSAVMLIPGVAGVNQVVNEFWAAENNLAADTSVSGKLMSSGCIMSGSTVGSSIATVPTAIAARQTALGTYLTASAPDLTDLLTRAGDIVNVQFVFRDAVDYGTSGLALYEPRWQQMARLTGQSLFSWTEQSCTDDHNSVTYPHPGQAAWTAGSAYGRQNLLLHSDVTGLAVDRGSTYETVAYNTPTFVNLDGNYPVITIPD